MVWAGRVCIFLSLHLLCCSAYDLNCTVHQNGDLTNYIIDSSVSLKNCSYHWRNGTNHVLANEMEQMKELVVNNSINHLITSKCSNISFTRHCASEHNELTVMCNTMCHEIAHNKGDGKASSANRTGPIIASVLLLVVGVLMGVLGFVGYKYKHKICRLFSCGPADEEQTNPTDMDSAYPLV